MICKQDEWTGEFTGVTAGEMKEKTTALYEKVEKERAELEKKKS